MRNNLLLENNQTNPSFSKDIHHVLQEIKENLQKEISCLLKTIESQEDRINLLLNIIEERNSTIKNLNKELEECQRNAEGNRQLFNKLLNDVDRLQQDVEWYKRTYERRTIWGILKDKLLSK